MFNDFQTIALVIGVFLQVVGLGFVIYQLKRVNTSIRVSAQSALYQQSASIRQLIVDRPDLRKYIFGGVGIDRGAADYDRVRTVAEMALNYLEHLVIQQDSLRAGDHTAWKRFVVRTIAASPVMQAILAENPGSYSSDLIDVYRSGRKSER